VQQYKKPLDQRRKMGWSGQEYN